MNDFSKNFEKYNFPNFGWTRFPKPPISEDDRKKIGLEPNSSNSLFLRTLCFKGFEEKLLNNQIPKEKYEIYVKRCELELNIFDELYFTDYILLVWKIIEKARELGVFIDYGRGSVVSSIVSWFLKMTGCDPIKYNLLFSRFVSKARAKSKIINGEVWITNDLAPDIDCNLGEGRDDIVEWLKEIYPNRVCKIANVSCLTGKILLKDVFKTLEEAKEQDAQEIANLIERRFGVVQDIEDVYKESKEFKDWADNHIETYKTCLSLRNLNRQFSSHASGYLLSFEELTEHTPLMLDSEKNIISAYTMDYVQSLKVDLLGLETNLVIKNILNNISAKIDEFNLDNDPIIYNQFQNNNLLPYGLYQISSDCAYKVCMNLKPKNVLELSHVNAIARPTSLAYEKPYIEQTAKCPHPLFKETLEWTRWLPLYQEQTSALVKSIGFDDSEAEEFRRCFAKKKIKEINEWVEKVKTKLAEKNLPQEAGDVLIKLAKESANYQFNLSHSIATSYTSALTVLLKYKYPLQFYLAWLNAVKNKPNSIEEISKIESELKFFNIKLLAPNIIKSKIDFIIEGENIRFGLKFIKSISEKSIDKLQKFKNEYQNPFEIMQAAKECNIPIGILSSLIQAGTLDCNFTKTRSRMVLEAQTFNLLTLREKGRVLELGTEFNYDLLKILKELTEKKDIEGKLFIKPSRLTTIRNKYDKYKQIYLQNSKHENLSCYYYEMALLGFSYSQKLDKILKETYPDIMTIQEVQGELNESKVIFCGEITETKFWTANNAKKTKCCKLKLKDSSSSIDVLLFNDTITYNEEQNGGKYEENQILVVKGTKKSEAVFANQAINQNVKVYTKLSELKEEKSIQKD